MNNGAPDASGLLAIGVTTELPMVGIFGLDFQLDFKCDAWFDFILKGFAEDSLESDDPKVSANVSKVPESRVK